MKRKSEQEIMAANRPEDIFTMNLDIIETEKEEYIERFKPKEYRTIQNFIVTKKVLLLYSQAVAKLENNEEWKEEEYKKICIKSISGKEYNVNYIEHPDFKLGEMYVTKQYIIYIVQGKYKKYYENYIQKTKHYSKPDKKIFNVVQYMLPNVEMHFETSDGDFAIFVKKPCEMYSLKEVLEYFDGGLKPEYVSSILTKLYFFSCYMGLVEMTHNAITLDNLFFSPGRRIEKGADCSIEDLRIVGVFGGWFFTTYLDEQIKGVPSEVYEFMPEKCRKRGYSSFEVDELAIKKLAKELLGAKIEDAPKPFLDWVNSKTIAKDSYEEYCNWEKVIISSFGKRRFVDIDISK